MRVEFADMIRLGEGCLSALDGLLCGMIEDNEIGRRAVKLFWVSLVGSFLLGMVSTVFAQTAEFSIQTGMQPSRNTPPEVVDMASVTDGPYGPVEGKLLQVFILAGSGMIDGMGESRELSRKIRKGSEHVLMFYEGRWQPLRPTGLRFGPEIGFALDAAAALPDETVGIVMPHGDDTIDITAKASRAIHAVPSRTVAFIWIDGKSETPVFNPEIVRTRLGEPLLDVIESSAVPALRQGESRTAWELRRGGDLTHMVFEKNERRRKDVK